ncbi:MAG: uracil-DNA glycosylase, partial [Methylocystaceae bacterium]
MSAEAATERQALAALLDWYLAAGVDIAVDDAPHDRFAESERPAAATAREPAEPAVASAPSPALQRPARAPSVGPGAAA